MKTRKYVSIQSKAFRSLNGNAKICVDPSYMVFKEMLKNVSIRPVWYLKKYVQYTYIGNVRY